ncbi:hypothetical protein B0H13DRAFT_1982591, partial [Mycena leptocephala]
MEVAEGVREGVVGVGGQRMHTARVCDGGWMHSGGERVVLACLLGLGFFFSFSLFNFFLHASSLYLLFLVTLLDLHYIFLVLSLTLFRVYVCFISAPLMTVSTLAPHACYI